MSSLQPRLAIRLLVCVVGLLGLVNAQAGTRTNKPPVISGSPSLTATVNVAYSFKPTASDPEGRRLYYMIRNCPTWATFSHSTGLLSGTPKSAGSYANIYVSVMDGSSTVGLPTFTITVSGAANRAPQIGGTPTAAITSGNAYSFAPTATDADGNALGFSIANKPTWAAFNTVTGALTGTPTSAGTYAGIVISVSDGIATTSLPSFAIAVTAPVVARPTVGSATLTWMPPTSNTDGSVLTDLIGYQIYYGTSSSALNSSVTVANSGITSYVVDNLPSATYYFAIKAVNASGVTSDLSSLVTKVVN